MGKRKDDPERQRRRAAAMAKRQLAALHDIGIDLETVPMDDRAAIELADRNVRRIREIGVAMSRRGSTMEPTPERQAKAPDGIREVSKGVGAPSANAVVWAPDAIRGRLTEAQYQAAFRLRDAHSDMSPRSPVGNTDGVGGGSDPSRRLPLSEKQEIAAREFQWVMSWLEGSFRRAVQNFVLSTPTIEGADRCMSIREWGARLTRYSGDQAYAAGVVAIIAALTRLVAVYAAYDKRVRQQCQRTDRMINSELGRRAARGGYVVALWEWCYRNGKPPETQEDMDQIRARSDEAARARRLAPPAEVERYHARYGELVAKAFREERPLGQINIRERAAS